MTNPINTDIKADIGQGYISIEGTTTTVINSLITRAANKINLITGTTTGTLQDVAIRNLADAYAITHVMAGLGPESVNNDKFLDMRIGFIKETKDALISGGYTPDGVTIKFESAND